MQENLRSLMRFFINSEQLLPILQGLLVMSSKQVLSYDGNNWTLVDTAGLRQTADIIEQEGIKRSFEEAHKADVILLVLMAAARLH